MSHLIIKMVKLTIWGLFPILIGIPGEEGQLFSARTQSPGTYHLTAVGDQEVLLDGAVYYEVVQDVKENGHTYSIIKFHLSPQSENMLHSLGFYIAQEKGVWPRGTYRMSNDIDGFQHHFDGVFAFADINVMGEQPFFANTGKLTIDYSIPKAIGGSLAMTMLNSKGKSVAVRGDFMAVLKN